MNFMYFIPLTAFLVNAFTVLNVLARRATKPVNRAYLFFAGSICCWVLIEFIQWLPDVDAVMPVLTKIQVVFWIPLGFLFTSFTYAVLDRKRDSIYWAVFIVAILGVSSAVLTDLAVVGYSRAVWGIMEAKGPLFLPIAVFAMIVPSAYSFALIYRRLRKATRPREKEVFRLILLGGWSTLILGFASDVLLPELLGVTTFPSLASSTTAVMALFIYAAVVKHGFLSVTPDQLAIHILDNAIDGIVLLDEKGRAFQSNESARQLLPVDDEGLPDVSVLGDFANLGAKPEGQEVRAVRGDVERVLAVTQSPIGQHPFNECSLVVLRDVTKRADAERDRRHLKKQLRQSQKMEAIGTLAGGVSHDLNNVLASILGLASVLVEETEEGSPWNEDATDILTAAQRGRNLTKDLLGFARKGQFVFQPVGLQSVVGELEQLLRRTIPKSVSIATDVPADLPLVEGDPDQISHALMNICINGMEAMGGSGVLSIDGRLVTVGEGEGGAAYRVSPGDYIALRISDTGCGMDPETQERVFEPFYSTKTKDKGTGLGLSMVYGTIKNHGGTVVLESEAGRGTTVTVVLPVAEQDQPLVDEPESDAPPGLGGKVLVVDDELSVLKATARMLGSLGYEAILAEGGFEALKIHSEQGPKLLMTVLDLSMPEIDGEETFKRLKAGNPDVRVLLASGHAKERLAEELLSAGALGFLHKPYSKEELAKAIDKAHRRRLASPDR